LIINYDLPVKYTRGREPEPDCNAEYTRGQEPEPDFQVYLHRVGRAGRFGRKGKFSKLLLLLNSIIIVIRLASISNFLTMWIVKVCPD